MLLLLIGSGALVLTLSGYPERLTANATSAPRVAYCIIGLLRGFSNESVWGSIRRNVIEAINAPANVFCRLKVEEQGDIKVARSVAVDHLQATGLQITTECDDWLTLTKLLGTLNATQMAAHEPRKMSVANAALQMRDCFDMVKASEQQRGQPYDFVVKLRSDDEICRRFPLWSQLPNHSVATYWFRGRSGSVQDHVAIVPRQFADLYFNLGREVWAPTATPEEVGRTCHQKAPPQAHSFDHGGECYLSHLLRSKGIPFDNGQLLGDPAICIWHTPLCTSQTVCWSGCKKQRFQCYRNKSDEDEQRKSQFSGCKLLGSNFEPAARRATPAGRDAAASAATMRRRYAGRRPALAAAATAFHGR